MNGLLSYWHVDLSAVIVTLLLIVFLFSNKGYQKKGVLVSLFFFILLCFFSPLSVLSGHYLFSAHMVVHVLLLLGVGPLLVAALPSGIKQPNKIFLFVKEHPVAGWLAGVSMMWFWHIPVLFNSLMPSMHTGGFHFIPVVESISLVVAGMLFSAPIIHPIKQYRIDALSGVVYLFTACIGCSLLGLLITFAPAGTYHHFLSAHDTFNLNKIILQQGITQATDQQAAGLIMWVPCCLVYVSGALYLLAQWFQQKQEVALSK